MANFAFTVGELISQIKKESKMNIAQLGSLGDMDTYIMYYITEALWEFAGEIKKKRTSDALIVSSNGYVTFKVGANDIEDMYSPMRIFVGSVDGKTLATRTSFESPIGWIKETANDPIHIKGAGTYILQYIAYPAKAISSTQVLDIPSTSFGLLKYKTISLIKESLNDLEGSKMASDLADAKIPTLIKANADARRYKG